MDNRVIIVVTEIQATIKHLAEKSLEERLKAAMSAAMGSWLISNEDEQFRAAVGAVLIDASPEEKKRLEAEIKALKALSAAIDGVPVNMLAVLQEAHAQNAIGLNGLWKDVKDEKAECNKS